MRKLFHLMFCVVVFTATSFANVEATHAKKIKIPTKAGSQLIKTVKKNNHGGTFQSEKAKLKKDSLNSVTSKDVYRTSRGSIIGTYSKLSRWIPKNLPGGGLAKYNKRNAHHIIPQAHARQLFPSANLNKMPAVNIARRDHMEKYHGRLDSEMANIRRRFPDLNNPEARSQTRRAYQRVYAEHPDWLEAIKRYFE